MNINRNNYEEYFLLYADKELSAEEKSMVEIFVQQNPDLEEEFVMLQQSVIKPDTSITLEDKSGLFRKSEFINENNYEEKFLLYADNELNLFEIEETEKFVLANPGLQKEFIDLQRVKYEPDTSVVFPDKSLLYKKEEKVRVIPNRWRYLAAAVLLGTGLWTGISYLQKDKAEQPPVTITKRTKSSNPVKPVKQKEETKNELVKTQSEQQDEPVKKIQEEKLIVPVKQPQQDVVKNDPQVNNNKPELINKPVDTVKTDIVKLDNNLPKPLPHTVEPDSKTITSTPVVQNSNNNNAQYASYIADEEVKNDNYVFYNITAEEFKKSKVGNFLKRVKRVVESRLPFKGKGLKIGNVEIAKDEQN